MYTCELLILQNRGWKWTQEVKNRLPEDLEALHDDGGQNKS